MWFCMLMSMSPYHLQFPSNSTCTELYRSTRSLLCQPRHKPTCTVQAHRPLLNAQSQRKYRSRRNVWIAGQPERRLYGHESTTRSTGSRTRISTRSRGTGNTASSSHDPVLYAVQVDAARCLCMYSFLFLFLFCFLVVVFQRVKEKAINLYELFVTFLV